MMTESEMRRMQQEAAKRAREMQNRARIQNQPVQKPPEPKQDIEESVDKQPQNKKDYDRTDSHNPINSNGLIGNIFDILMKDKERTLILCLVLMLMDEKTDNNLLIALLYLLI